LCYVNECWGGTDNGYRLVSDSNYDWGQGLPELVAWQRQHGADVEMWYFGSDPAVDSLPVRHVPLQVLNIQRPDDVLAHTQARYFAVSTTLLYGSATDQPAYQPAVSFLRSCPPTDRTSTFLIFDRQTLQEKAAR
jgi:hypothetical protein